MQSGSRIDMLNGRWPNLILAVSFWRYIERSSLAYSPAHVGLGRYIASMAWGEVGLSWCCLNTTLVVNKTNLLSVRHSKSEGNKITRIVTALL